MWKKKTAIENDAEEIQVIRSSLKSCLKDMIIYGSDIKGKR